MSPKEREFVKRIDEVLHYCWDPIGVAGEPAARDEYYLYIPKIFSLLIEEKVDQQEIVSYLMHVSKNLMELASYRDKAIETVNLLMRWKTKIFFRDVELETDKLFKPFPG